MLQFAPLKLQNPDWHVHERVLAPVYVQMLLLPQAPLLVAHALIGVQSFWELLGE